MQRSGGRCANLLVDVGVYRYGSDPENRDAETRVDDHNHALAALRYLVCRLDRRRMALAEGVVGNRWWD